MTVGWPGEEKNRNSNSRRQRWIWRVLRRSEFRLIKQFLDFHLPNISQQKATKTARLWFEKLPQTPGAASVGRFLGFHFLLKVGIEKQAVCFSLTERWCSSLQKALSVWWCSHLVCWWQPNSWEMGRKLKSVANKINLVWTNRNWTNWGCPPGLQLHHGLPSQRDPRCPGEFQSQKGRPGP